MERDGVASGRVGGEVVVGSAVVGSAVGLEGGTGVVRGCYGGRVRKECGWGWDADGVRQCRGVHAFRDRD